MTTPRPRPQLRRQLAAVSQRIAAARQSKREREGESRREAESVRPIGTSVCGLKINLKIMFLLFSLPLPPSSHIFQKGKHTHTNTNTHTHEHTHTHTGKDHCADISNAASSWQPDRAVSVKNLTEHRCPLMPLPLACPSPSRERTDGQADRARERGIERERQKEREGKAEGGQPVPLVFSA